MAAVMWSIARCNIGHKRAEDIERSAHADGLLYFHIGRNLIHRNVARSLNHNLNVFLPGTFGEFAEAHQLFNLADIRCVGKAARTAGVTERNGHIVFTADIENLIVILVERILLAGHAHPGEHEGAAAGNNIHFPFVFADLIDGFSGDAAVQGDEIDTVLGMEADDVNKIFGGQRIQVSSGNGSHCHIPARCRSWPDIRRSVSAGTAAYCRGSTGP